MRNRPVPDRQDCRIVVFYRVAPDRTKISLPPGFQLRELNGYAVGGIALVRRLAACSSLLPNRLVTCATVFHFVNAMRVRRQRVETGSLVMRCDTSSRFSAWIGRGWHWRHRYHHARFRIVESPESIRIQCDSDDRAMHMAMDAQPRRIPSQRSVFGSKDQLIQILQDDLPGLRLTRRPRRRGFANRPICQSQLIPLHVKHLESSMFADPQRFPSGAAEFDSAYWLRDDEAVWSEQGTICCDVATA